MCDYIDAAQVFFYALLRFRADLSLRSNKEGKARVRTFVVGWGRGELRRLRSHSGTEGGSAQAF